MQTILVFETSVADTNLVQSITFQCLGGILEGDLELSRDERLFRLKIFGSPIWTTDLRKERPSEEEEVHEWAGFPRDLDLLQEFLRVAKRLLRDILKAISFEGFHCHLEIGMPEPEQTGIILGMSYPIVEMIRSAFPEDEIKVVVEPVWGRAKLDIFSRGILRLRLVSLVVPLIRFFLAKSTRKFLRSMKKKA